MFELVAALTAAAAAAHLLRVFMLCYALFFSSLLILSLTSNRYLLDQTYTHRERARYIERERDTRHAHGHESGARSMHTFLEDSGRSTLALGCVCVCIWLSL